MYKIFKRDYSVVIVLVLSGFLITETLLLILLLLFTLHV